MKFCIIVPDGMADAPVAELDGRTPLEVAETPNMDRLAREGRLGTVRNVPEGLRPDSDVALLSVMGYDPREHPSGRAPIEALGMGMDLSARRAYFRCNLVTLDEETMADHSGGHIGDHEARILLRLLNEEAAPEGVEFHPGKGYRCIMTCPREAVGALETVPPQDILGRPIADHLPRGEGAEWLTRLMLRSREIFLAHDINRVRADLGENPVSMVWPWGHGLPLWLPAFEERYRRRGAMVAAVPLARGLARAVGWDAPAVPGATGYYDTDYGAKAGAALELLADHDLVMIHIEATDEASHEGNIRQKIECIEQIDRHVVGPLLEAFEAMEEGRILLVPDHQSRVEQQRHTDAPVPFAVYGARMTSVLELPFSERAAEQADLRVRHGHELMAFLLRR